MSSVAYDFAIHDGLPYRIHAPVLPKGSRAPLVIFLHGVDERGADNEAQLSTSFFADGNSLFGANTLARHESFVIAPQVPISDKWIAIDDWNDPAYGFRPNPTLALARVIDLIKKLISEHPIDATRIYVTGLSMGGFGTFDIIAREPKLFAAAFVVCGRGDPALAGNLKHIPITMVHGAKDKLVSVEFARQMAAALKKVAAPARYIEYPDVGHGAWEKAYRDPEIITWLFSQRLKT